MALTLTPDPLAPEPGDLVTLTIGGNTQFGDPAAARWELITLPDQSELDLGMLVDSAGDYIQTFTPDVPGDYRFRAYDVRRVVGFSQFAGDASGGAREVILSTEDTRLAVFAITPLDLRIQTLPGHDVTLRLGLADLIIKTAELVDPSSDLARIAALDSGVLAAVDALVGEDIDDINENGSGSGAGVTLKQRVVLLLSAYGQHRNLTAGSVHGSADTTNVVNRETPESDEAALLTLVEIYDRLLGHMLAGQSGGTWHTNDDTKNLPITPKPTTKMQAHVTACDLEERVYEAHRTQTSVPTAHGGTGDSTNTLPDPSLLTNAIVAYLRFIADNSGATPPTGEESGALRAQRTFGMVPAP